MTGHFRAAIIAAVVLASPLHQARAQSGRATAAPVLQNLTAVGELRSQFEIDGDKIRIVLLLSPT